jgi:hypothetical protein
MRLTFAQVFGEGASQTSEILVIPKSSLGYSGDSPQALLVALLEKVRQYCNGYILTKTGDFIHVNGEPLEFDNSLYWERLNVLLTRTQTKARDGAVYYSHIFKVKILLPNDGSGITLLNINELDAN